MSEMMRDKDPKNTVSLTFALCGGRALASGLTFTDDDEFVYQGRMYDVISESKAKGRVTYTCYADSRETELNQDLFKMIDSDQDLSSQRHKNSLPLKDVPKDYTNYIGKVHCFLPEASIRSVYGINTDKFYYSAVKTVFSPPPESLAS
jgi:hypothetical protein